MPELPEVEAVRRKLASAMTGETIADVELRRPDLRSPFPPRFRERLRGNTVVAVKRRAKYLLLQLSSDEALVAHLGMSGWFYVERPTTPPNDTSRLVAHDHVVFHMTCGTTVIFNDPRRFGFMDLFDGDGLADHPVLGSLGPEPLSRGFGPAVLARGCAGRTAPLKIALLDQRLVAGIGNIYASEALHRAGLSPRRRAGSIATRSGMPRDSAVALTAAIKEVLTAAIRHVSAHGYGGSRFRVYEREGERCLRRGCAGRIRRLTQGGRSTFYCPVCQR